MMVDELEETKILLVAGTAHGAQPKIKHVPGHLPQYIAVTFASGTPTEVYEKYFDAPPTYQFAGYGAVASSSA
jgi:hypothetical protein